MNSNDKNFLDMDRKELSRLKEQSLMQAQQYQNQIDLMDKLILSNVSDMLIDKSNRDWKEDFKHENGNYKCTCGKCENHFYGHKRRVRCKLCSF